VETVTFDKCQLQISSDNHSILIVLFLLSAAVAFWC
jgi:hypothetical protein